MNTAIKPKTTKTKTIGAIKNPNQITDARAVPTADGNVFILADLGGGVYGYQGATKDRIALTDLSKKGGGNRLIVFSDSPPKYAALMSGDLPLALERFTPLQDNDPAYVYSVKVNKPGYGVKFNLPGLLLHSFNELWEGRAVVEYDDQTALEIQIPRASKSALGRRGKAENIRYFLDTVCLNAGIDGEPVLMIEGWSISATTNQPVTVELFLDGERLQSTVCTKMRPDVLDSLGIKVPHTPGFTIHQKIRRSRPRTVAVQLSSQADAEAIQFPFEKIPGAQQFLGVQDTVFQEEKAATPFALRRPLRRFFTSRQRVEDDGGLSIIIPTRLSTPNIFPLVEALRSANPADEIIIIGHDLSSEQREKVKSISDVYINVSGRFNWSKFNNHGASRSSKRAILFMNDDVLPIAPNWRSRLLSTLYASDSVGAVGARLVGKDLRFQHDGIELYGRFTHHVNIGIKEDPVYDVDVIGPLDGVTGAFLAVRADLFRALAGFDESLDIIGNDMEFCLRLGARGYFSAIPSSLYFYHAEGSSRSNMRDNEISRILDERLPLAARIRASDVGRGLDKGGEPITIRQRKKFSPAKILFIKIDHIGDFYSALPAMGRIRDRYPKAKITLICSPEVAEIAIAEGGFDEVLPVRVFNKLSGKGLEAKREIPRLLLERDFDVAVDFRKHDDAREIVESIKSDVKFCFRGSSSKADGTVFFYGHREEKGEHYSPTVLSEFSAFSDFVIRYLDEYPTDQGLPKPTRTIEHIPEAKTIRIFPLSGNDSRAYPVPLYMQYAILHKAMYPHHHVEFVVPSDQLDHVFDIDRINLLKGAGIKIAAPNSLSSVLHLVRAADLIVTNNTGPMWMATNHSVPTIAVFSGVVSPTHWLPKGAIQIARDVSCSPCHIASAAQCSRNMFCLNSIDPSYIFILAMQALGKRGGFD